MIFTIVKLRPRGSFHIGERENWREGSKVYIPSDTIFSALCYCYLLLYGEVESFLKGFIDSNPPFLISSAFPFVKETLFFPIPKNQISRDKEVRKIKYIDLHGLERLLNGKKIDDIKDEVRTIPPFPWEIENVPRIGLNRWTNHPGENFFYFGQVTYKSDTGLFLFIEFKESSFKSKLIATLNLLAQEGLGGDRTVGRGFFYKPEILEIKIHTTKFFDGIYSLSMYSPLQEEIMGIERGFYEIEERKGYIFSPFCQSLRRRSIRLFTEGSVFPSEPKRVGKIVDVTPDAFDTHKVYRYGYIFSLPCKLEVT